VFGHHARGLTEALSTTTTQLAVENMILVHNKEIADIRKKG
jgi:hypothetical protein